MTKNITRSDELKIGDHIWIEWITKGVYQYKDHIIKAISGKNWKLENLPGLFSVITIENIQNILNLQDTRYIKWWKVNTLDKQQVINKTGVIPEPICPDCNSSNIGFKNIAWLCKDCDITWW